MFPFIVQWNHCRLRTGLVLRSCDRRLDHSALVKLTPARTILRLEWHLRLASKRGSYFVDHCAKATAFLIRDRRIDRALIKVKNPKSPAMNRSNDAFL